MLWKLSILLAALPLVAARLPSNDKGEEVDALGRGDLNVPEDERGDALVAPLNGRARQDTRRLPKLESFYIEGPGKGRKRAVRGYLNGLVARSVAATEHQLSNIAFVKTHKTASTTLACMLFRYAHRHHVKLANFDHQNSAVPLDEAVSQINKGKGRVDIMHYHHSVFGEFDHTWEWADHAYRKIMRDPETINFLTVLREPRSHLLSYYYYFMQPNTEQSIEDFLGHPKHPKDKMQARLKNPMSAEFGVKTAEDMDDLLNKYLSNFSMVLLTEQFDEGLMVLRRHYGWDMIDVTYQYLMETTTGSTRYDGKKLLKAPHFDDLSKEVQDKIDSLTNLDRTLYAAAEEHYAKRRESVAKHLEGDRKEFMNLQVMITTYLTSNSSSNANKLYKAAKIYSNEIFPYDF